MSTTGGGKKGGGKKTAGKTKMGGRGLTTRVKSAKGRRLSSTRWLERQLNDPYVAEARRQGYRSRAAFKLKELDDKYHVLKPGARVLDLGAAPGGWSWCLVQRGLKVVAVDNGPLKGMAAEHPHIKHLRQDGFRYRPRKPVDWLVCDMVERPQRVATLMADWLASGQSQRAVFNLKLPMKKRVAALDDALGIVRGALDAKKLKYTLRAKQLYHDREEVTVFVARGKR